MSGALQIPGQASIDVIHHKGGTLANQVVANLQSGNSLQIHVSGGFTRLERAVLDLACHDISEPEVLVARAQALLAACEKAESPKEPHGEEKPGESPIILG